MYRSIRFYVRSNRIFTLLRKIFARPLRANHLRSFTLICAQFILLNSYSAADVRINAQGFRNLNLGVWAGQGSVELTQSFCVESVNGRRNRSDQIRPYSLAIENRSVADAFVLEGVQDQLPFTIRFVDLRTRVEEAMQPGLATVQDKTGAAFRCRSGGNNAAVRIRFDIEDLKSVEAGRYRSQFRVIAVGGSNGSESNRLDNINVSFVIDPVIAISKLNDLTLTGQALDSALFATESFCVFSNRSSAYSVTVDSSNATEDNFFLKSNVASAKYSLQWEDDRGVQPLLAGTTYNARLVDMSGGADCVAGDNAGIRLAIAADEIEGLAAGNYSDTITIRVSPE